MAESSPLSSRLNGSESGLARTLIDELLVEQGTLTAVEQFARTHERHELPAKARHYRNLLPATAPAQDHQYAFEVNLDHCSGCKACVTACHSLNGLDDDETWRSVGLLLGSPKSEARHPEFGFQQHVTTACHHCVDPGCLNGCPVLAYDKDPVTGIVRHLDDQCIGCQYCVMKCPYEVPKYSSRLGIVRKCDLCANRLSVGEAPACVQACPNEAIRISLVNTATVRDEFRNLKPGIRNNSKARSPNPVLTADGVRVSAFRLPSTLNRWLPDSPDPAITLPTTRYRSANPALEQSVAADHAALRLDQPHWPLVIMLVLTQAAAGLSVLGAILLLAGVGTIPRPLPVVSFALLVIGLTAAVFHLGQPLKAWRSFLGWRTSWLSRELIAFHAFAATAAWAVILPQFPVPAAVFGLVGVAASAMVYVDTRRPFWCARITFGNFLGTTLLLGATFGAVIFGWLGDLAIAQFCVLASLLVRTALFFWRRFEWRTARHDPGSPIHFNARIIGELLAWTQQANAALFAASTLFGLLAIAGIAQAVPWWASLAALTTLSSEVIARYVFFAAGSNRRMPGGVAA